MPLIIPTNSISDLGYEVDNSLRFDDGSSDYLNKTFGSAGNRKTWTWSGWIKRSNISTNSRIVSTDLSSNTFLGFSSNDTIRFIWTSGAYENFTSAVYRDVSAWYHIVVAVDTTQATASDRLKLYVNGVLQIWGTYNPPLQNAESGFNNSSVPHYINSYNGTNEFFDGYMSEVVFIDGQALDPTSFGEFDADTGIWKPIDVSGLTFGTNGFYLDFENSGSLGADVSGNGNNFTVNNLTSIDQTTDTPTNNFATLNFLDKDSAVVLSNGNLTSTGGSNKGFRASQAFSQGKWYWEVKWISGGGTILVGIADDAYATSSYVGSTSKSWGISNTGKYYNNASLTSYGNSFTSGDIMGVALDADNGYLYFSKNGVFQNSGDPTSGATGTGGILVSNPRNDFWFPAGSNQTGTYMSFNFGNPPFTISSGNSDGNGYGNFEYAVPSGYYALNTKNLAEYG